MRFRHAIPPCDSATTFPDLQGRDTGVGQPFSITILRGLIELSLVPPQRHVVQLEKIAFVALRTGRDA
jgi:hypothetical protein